MAETSGVAARGLPGVLLLALYGIALSAPLLLAALGGPAEGLWREAASASGLVGGTMLMLQLVTSGRFEILSGRVGIDVTMAFHKWTARILLAILVLHPLLAAAPFDAGRPLSILRRFGATLTAPRTLTGLLALLLVALILVLAIRRDRLPVRYELWRATHGLLALAAVWLVAIHAVTADRLSDEPLLRAFWLLLAAATSLSALAVYTLRAWAMRRRPWRVTANRKVAEGLYEVTLRATTGAGLRFRAGQFVWIAFEPRRFPLFDHPFSIASSPRRPDEIALLVKQAGDFTGGIAGVGAGALAGIDGPHGSFVLGDRPGDAVLLVAGGVGIAPALSILRDLADRADRRPVRLIYACRSRAAMIDPREIGAIAAGLDFEATYLVEQAGADAPCELGVVTAERLATSIAGLDPGRLEAMICGPGAMTATVADALRALGVPLARIRYERFDYADGARSAKDRRVAAGFRLMAAIVAACAIAFALRP